MDKIIIENFRCFRTLREVPLAPLTFLVGENSTGKTSFLAAIRIASSLQNMGMFPDFNGEPFALGAYEQIANYSAGRAGRAGSFTIGYEDLFQRGRRQEREQSVKVLATFCQHGVQPQISEWRLESQKYRVVISYAPSGEKVDLTIETPSGRMLLIPSAQPSAYGNGSDSLRVSYINVGPEDNIWLHASDQTDILIDGGPPGAGPNRCSLSGCYGNACP